MDFRPGGFVAGENAICGTVTAPLYYDRETGETVTLPMIHLKSKSESPVNPPLMMLQGDPGQTLETMLFGFSSEMPMDGYGFAQTLQNALWAGPALPLIPSLITTAADGDSSVIEEVMNLQPYEPVSLGITSTVFFRM